MSNADVEVETQVDHRSLAVKSKKLFHVAAYLKTALKGPNAGSMS